MKFSQNISKIYHATAMIFFNICIFILFINICLFVIFEIKDNFFNTPKINPVAEKYNDPSLQQVYPQLNGEAINSLLDETWSRPYIYENFTLFKERPYKGRYVNVDENGFRLTKNQGPWPPETKNLNIFLFGGSTTFGYGLPDNQTIASYLQEFLANRLKQEVRVYNFGRGSYYSQQERILFEKLLLSGFIPDLAIFIDGFNDIYQIEGNPAFSKRFEQFFVERKQGKAPTDFKLIDRLPMMRIAEYIKHKLRASQDKPDNIDMANSAMNYNDNKKVADQNINKSDITKVIKRYIENKKITEAIAKAYAVKTVFVWQPISSYKYDLKYHLFASTALLDKYLIEGYLSMEEFVENKSLGKNFLWLANIQENIQKPLYVDKVHYSAEMSEMVAVNIGNLLLEHNLLTEYQ